MKLQNSFCSLKSDIKLIPDQVKFYKLHYTASGTDFDISSTYQSVPFY